MLRHVPIVGGMLEWIAPFQDDNEGMRYDLVTSTMKKPHPQHRAADAVTGADGAEA